MPPVPPSHLRKKYNKDQDKPDTYTRALQVWGSNAQILTAIGECAELIDALVKRQRGQSNEDEKVIDEIADVMIMCRQLERLFGTKAVQERITYKLNRINERLDRVEAGREGELN